MTPLWEVEPAQDGLEARIGAEWIPPAEAVGSVQAGDGVSHSATRFSWVILHPALGHLQVRLPFTSQVADNVSRVDEQRQTHQDNGCEEPIPEETARRGEGESGPEPVYHRDPGDVANPQVDERSP